MGAMVAMAKDTTTIEVRVETYKRLNGQKGPGESFDDVITWLLDRREGLDDRELRQQWEPAEPDGATGGVSSDSDGELIRCEHCGYEWRTQSGMDRPTCSSCNKNTDRLAPT